MGFTITWNESYPSGSDLLSGVDTYIQQDKIAVRERLESLLGISDFATRYPMTADSLKMNGTADSKVIGGTASWSVRDSADSANNLKVTDVGGVIVRNGFNVAAGTSTFNGKLEVSGSQARCVEYDAGNFTGAKTVNWDNGNNQKITLTGNSTLTLSNPVTGTWYQLRIVQDATGSRTVTWPANVKWMSGTTPTLTTTASRTDILALFYNGTNYLGTIVGLNWDG